MVIFTWTLPNMVPLVPVFYWHFDKNPLYDLAIFKFIWGTFHNVTTLEPSQNLSAAVIMHLT